MGGNAELAAKAFEAKKGFRFCAAYTWGAAPFKPGDEVWEILGAKTDGDAVSVSVLNTAMVPPCDWTLRISHPGPFKATDTELRIASASSITLGTWYRAQAAGTKYQTFLEDVPEDSFEQGSLPALRLVVAPSLLAGG